MMCYYSILYIPVKPLHLCRAITRVLLWTRDISLYKHNLCVLPRVIEHSLVLVIIHISVWRPRGPCSLWNRQTRISLIKCNLTLNTYPPHLNNSAFHLQPKPNTIFLLFTMVTDTYIHIFCVKIPWVFRHLPGQNPLGDTRLHIGRCIIMVVMCNYSRLYICKLTLSLLPWTDQNLLYWLWCNTQCYSNTLQYLCDLSILLGQ